MLLGGLHNPTHQGTLATPDSTYEWRNFGEHVTQTQQSPVRLRTGLLLHRWLRGQDLNL